MQNRPFVSHSMRIFLFLKAFSFFDMLFFSFFAIMMFQIKKNFENNIITCNLCKTCGFLKRLENKIIKLKDELTEAYDSEKYRIYGELIINNL